MVAFRRKAGSKTTVAHFEKASEIGFLLRPLVPMLDTLGDAKTVFRTPSCEYDVVERFAEQRRRALGISQTASLDYSPLIDTFKDNGAVLVPCLWGKRHENALHIFLPDEDVTFVYLNVDVRIEDFKFWMAHELAHVFTPKLCGTNEGEDFADAFAGALLFPGEIAERCYKQALGKDKNPVVRILQIAAAAQGVSLFTAFSRVMAYRSRYGGEPLAVDETTIHRIRMADGGETVSKTLWGNTSPSPDLYIEAVRSQFHSPFFSALRKLLNSGRGGVGYVQQILDASRADAVAIHHVLTR